MYRRYKLSIDEKIEILKAYDEGKTVWVNNNLGNDVFDNWRPINKTNQNYHEFNFEDYDYTITEPKSWQDQLNELKSPRKALVKSIQRLKENRKHIVSEYTRTQNDCKYDCLSVENNGLIDLWNFAMDYGKANPKAKHIEGNLLDRLGKLVEG